MASLGRRPPHAAAVGSAIAAILALTAADPATAQTATPSACQLRLTAEKAVFKPIGDMAVGSCGGPDVVLLQRIAAPDMADIAVEPPATLRCEMAEAVVRFVRDDLGQLAGVMGAPLAAIENYDSYDCRGRNRVAAARLSEHGRANALDIRSLRLRDGRVVRPADVVASLDFRRSMRAAVCARFTTVLGPGSDGYHEDHIHMDLAQRSGGYRVCQWDLHDGGPREVLAHAAASLVPLPRSRPLDLGAAASLPIPLTVEGLRR